MNEPKSLREVRLENLLSIQELAEAAGMSYAAVYSIESGRSKNLRMRTIRTLSEALGVDHRSVTEFVAALA